MWVQYARYLRASGARRFRAVVQVQGLHRDRTDRPGFARDARARHASPSSLALVLGIPVGTFAALHQNSAADYAAMSLAVVGIAIPSFVVLPFLGLFFGIYLHWLPVAGWEPESIRYLVLPVIALALPPLGVHRAAHARQHARSAAQSVHPHGDREGSAAADGDFAARLAPGAGAGGGLSGAGGRLHHDRLAGGRVDRRACRASAGTWCKALSIATTRWCSGMVIIYSTRADRHGTARRSAVSPGSIRESGSTDERRPVARCRSALAREFRRSHCASCVIAILVLLAHRRTVVQSQRHRGARLVARRQRTRSGAARIGSAPTGWAAIFSCARSTAHAFRWPSASSRAPSA